MYEYYQKPNNTSENIYVYYQKANYISENIYVFCILSCMFSPMNNYLYVSHLQENKFLNVNDFSDTFFSQKSSEKTFRETVVACSYGPK